MNFAQKMQVLIVLGGFVVWIVYLIMSTKKKIATVSIPITHEAPTVRPSTITEPEPETRHDESYRAVIQKAEEKTRVKTRLLELVNRQMPPDQILKDLFVTFEERFDYNEIIEITAERWTAPILASALSTRGYELNDIA